MRIRRIHPAVLSSAALLVFLLIAVPARGQGENSEVPGYHFMPTDRLLEIVVDPKSEADAVGGAFRALAFAGDPAAVPQIDRLLGELGPTPRAVSLLHLLGQIGDPKALPVAALQLRVRSERIVQAARETVMELMGPADARSFFTALDWLETQVGALSGTPAFCSKLAGAKLGTRDGLLPGLDVSAGTALTRLVQRLCPEASQKAMDGLWELPEHYGAEALALLAKPDAGGCADQIFGRLRSYGQDAVPILAAAIRIGHDAGLRLSVARILAERPWTALEARRGRIAMAPDFVLERVAGLCQGFADTDETVRLAAIAGVAELIESQGDGFMMSTGYRRLRFRKALRAYVGPVSALLADKPAIREKAAAALKSMRLPEASEALTGTQAPAPKAGK